MKRLTILMRNNIVRRVLKAALAIICFAGVLSAAEAQTLNECIERGLQNNYNLQITRNEQEIAHNNATWANAGGAPTVDATARVSPSWTQLDRSVARTTGAVNTQDNAFDNALSAGVTLNWTLFDGYKIQTNYKQLQLLEQQGEIATRMAVEDLVADISAEYYNYLQQLIRQQHYRYTMSLSRERLRIADTNYEIGRFSGLDRQLARSDYHADSAAYIRQSEAVMSSCIRLNKLMGNDDVDRIIVVGDTSIVVRNNLQLSDLWQRAQVANTSLLYAKQNSQMAELDMKKVMARNYPYLKLAGQYGYNYNVYSKGINSQRHNLGLSAGLTLGFNIFDGNRKRERQNAQLAIQNRQLKQNQLQLDLRADLATCWQSYRNDLELLNLQRENLKIAESNMQSAMERYKIGNMSGFDMRQVQKNLLDAEEKVLQAEYDAKLCEISLLLMSGDIAVYLEK